MAHGFSLDDKYTTESGRILVSAMEALVRLPMMQRRRDVARGLNTAGFISGYRGSPLAGYDHALDQAKPHLDHHHIRFTPGINEELAATAVWGTQQVNLFEGANYDGVFSMWYGKGPGVDRCGDVFKHANMAGTSPHGGVLAIVGDDHGARSSTLAHQSEQALAAAMIPILHPADVQEIIDFGLYGFALSRYSGCWAAMKLTADTAECSATVMVGPGRAPIEIPGGFKPPSGGLGIRWPEHLLGAEDRLVNHKLAAAKAFVRANGLDRQVIGGTVMRIGIVAAGKTSIDVGKALGLLGIDEGLALQIGLGVYKVAMTWPLEGEGLRAFACGLDEIIVVEEKRGFLETQIKEFLYNIPAAIRPRVVGKRDENGRPLISAAGELTPGGIARTLAGRLERFDVPAGIASRARDLDARDQREVVRPGTVRTAHFCSGCPHNISTRVPDGSIALAGIGCHTMATRMDDRPTVTICQMGGEGMSWVGQAPFTSRTHVFQNLGDGTYSHSGLMAIRAAAAAGVTMTYKILFNGAVAMTGGQAVEGDLSVAAVTHQLYGAGVRRIAVVCDDPGRYGANSGLAKGVTVHRRERMDQLQQELRDWPGVSVLIYDQLCAAEARRRRKRGTLVDPAKHVFINQALCEGCGDCASVSNCLAVVPVETEFGRKRRIDQSSCNKDFSCLEGFCPALVTVHGAEVRKPVPPGDPGKIEGDIPDPGLPALISPYAMVIAGIGGTGVVTAAHVIAMAAHLEGKGCAILDETGLAQKGGPVASHVTIAQEPNDIHGAHISQGAADAVLGCDMVVAASPRVMETVSHGFTRALINSHAIPTAAYNFDLDAEFGADRIMAALGQALGDDQVDHIDGGGLNLALFGDSMTVNIFMLGAAYQKGLVPVGREALVDAIELNGVAVEANLRAFAWGRRAAFDPTRVKDIVRSLGTGPIAPAPGPMSLDEMVTRRFDELQRYQGRAYGKRYRDVVAGVREAEDRRVGGDHVLARAVAHNLHRLMAYKDEYETARLYSDGGFEKDLARQFTGGFKLEYHLAPPVLAKRDAETGIPRTRTFGPWVMYLFRVLAKFRFLRGTWFDPFGWTRERRAERHAIRAYEDMVHQLAAELSADNLGFAVEIARLPESVRGFGHIKSKSAETA
ncbi:MAG: indolepyruvate ferredoxin oxidoreductase family protein, partial [Alphaproteobacteria bacterium]